MKKFQSTGILRYVLAGSWSFFHFQVSGSCFMEKVFVTGIIFTMERPSNSDDLHSCGRHQREISITKRWRGPSVSKGHTSKVLGPWTNSLGSKSHASMRKIIPSLTIDFYSPGNEVTKREIFRLVIQGVRGFFSIWEGTVQLLEIK